MTISEMLGQSGLLTLLGMVVVFSFILILIFCMGLLHKVVSAFHLDKEVKKATNKSAKPASAPRAAAPAVDQMAIIAAIAAAVHEKESI